MMRVNPAPSRHWPPILVAILLLAGCGTTKPSDYALMLSQTPVCCQSVGELTPLSFDPEKPQLALNIGKTENTALVIDNTKTFAVLVKLPEEKSPYSIKVQSLSVGESVFPPRIRLLNQDFSVSREIRASQFRAQRGLYMRTLFFNEQNLGERYLLVYMDSDQQGTSHQLTDINVNNSVVVLPIGSFNIQTSSGDIQKTVNAAAGGTLQLVYERYAPQAIGK